MSAVARLPARRALVATAATLAIWPGLTAASGARAIRHDRTSFFSLARSGAVLFAAGERGVIARSSDDGLNWTVSRLPTPRNLTTVLGDPGGVVVAAGHGGVVFVSADQGETWTPLADASIKELNPDRDPILCGLIGRDGSIHLAGAFGLMIESRDRGLSWRRSAPVAPDFDRHVYDLFESVDGRSRWLVGESGTLAHSDSVTAWSVLDSPYPGSFFGGLITPDHATLVFGMRGSIYRKAKDSTQWHQCPCPQPIAWMAGHVLPDRRIALVGDQGWMAVSQDNGRSVELLRAAEASLADLITHADGAISLAGVQGLSRRPMPSVNPGPTRTIHRGTR